jgi:hypothetical protein
MLTCYAFGATPTIDVLGEMRVKSTAGRLDHHVHKEKILVMTSTAVVNLRQETQQIKQKERLGNIV